MLRWFVILQFQKRFNHRLYEFVVFLRKKELFRRSTCGVTCTPSSHVLFICIELSLKATTTIYSMHTHNATAASQKWLEICSIIEHWTLDILIRLHANKSVKQMSFFPYKWDSTQNPKIKWWKMHRMLFLDRAKAKIKDNLPGIIIKASVCHVFEMFRCRFVVLFALNFFSQSQQSSASFLPSLRAFHLSLYLTHACRNTHFERSSKNEKRGRKGQSN